MTKFTIRRTKDVQLVRSLDAECFKDEADMTFEGHYLWIARDERGEIAGYAAMQITDSGTAAFLSRCGVLPAFRGKGLQKQFIRVRERTARKLGVRNLITYTNTVNLGSINSLIASGYRLYRPAYSWGFKFGDGLYFWKSA